VLGRVLDETYPPAVRRGLVPLTAARLTSNAVYRFAPPFLATIARGLHVELADLGVALAITEVSGFTSPLVGHLIDRVPRRLAMSAGLVGIAAGAVIAGASTGIVMFTAGLLVLATTKVVFDVALISWTADHVPYDRRSRVTGLIETSWALGLLIGVTLLGLVAAVTSWRWSYVIGGVAVSAMAGVLTVRLDRDRPRHHHRAAPPTPTVRLDAAGWAAVVGMLGLTAAAQSLFVTFGAWLQDVFGLGTAALSAVTFGIGALELAASTTSAARTDRWGKERSVMRGVAVMVPCALALVVLDDRLAPGLVVLALFIAAFEFSIVSTIPVGAELVPATPGRGIGALLAAGTVGRMVVAIPATRLYDSHGFGAPALLAVVFAALAGFAMLARDRLLSAR
jgi:MFS transporter, DHA1 family, inner membrane transport protein